MSVSSSTEELFQLYHKLLHKINTCEIKFIDSDLEKFRTLIGNSSVGNYLLATILYLLGLTQEYLGNKPKSGNYYSEIVHLEQAHENINQKAFLSLANTSLRNFHGDYGNTIEESKIFFEKLKNKDFSEFDVEGFLPQSFILGLFHFNLGYFYEVNDDFSLSLDNYDEAIHYFLIADKKDNKNTNITIFNEIESSSLNMICYCLIQKAITESDQNGYDNALKNCKKALSYFQKNPIRNLLVLYWIHFTFGYVYDIKDIKSSLKSYLKALNVWNDHLHLVQVYEKENKGNPNLLNNIGECYEHTKNLTQALNYYHLALGNYENEDEKDYTLCNIGRLLITLGKFDEGMSYLSKGLEILERNIPSYQDFIQTYELIYKSNPNNDAINKLIRSKRYGLLWYNLFYTHNRELGESFNGIFWKSLWDSNIRFWEDIKDLKSNNSFEQSVFSTNLKWKKLLGRLYSHIDTETNLNFLMGCNDLNSDESLITENNFENIERIKPLWHIEFPLHLLHEEKYLIYRINESIMVNGEKWSLLPNLNNDSLKIKEISLNLRSNHFPEQIVDIKLSDEVEGLLENEESFIKIIKLDESLKSSETLELFISFKIKIVKNKEQDLEIKSNSIKFNIPVVRKNGIQKLEKFRLKHMGSLTWLIAITSIIMSLMNYWMNIQLFSSFFSSVSSLTFFNLNFLSTATFLSFFFILLLIIGLFYQREEDKNKILDRVLQK